MVTTKQSWFSVLRTDWLQTVLAVKLTNLFFFFFFFFFFLFCFVLFFSEHRISKKNMQNQTNKQARKLQNICMRKACIF